MAILTDVGNDLTNLGIYQPKQRQKWRLAFTGLGLNPDDGTFMTVQAVTAERPKLSFEQVPIDRYNTRVYIAGKHTFEPINIVFEDDVGGLVAQAIQNQLEKQQNIIAPSSSPLMPSALAGQDYKFSVRIDMLDGNDGILESWSVEGAWLANVDWTDLDYTASESVRINITLRFDHARQQLSGVEKKAHPGSGPL